MDAVSEIHLVINMRTVRERKSSVALPTILQLVAAEDDPVVHMLSN